MDLYVSTDALCPLPHTAKTMAAVIPGKIESAAIVSNPQTEPPVFDTKIDVNFRRAGMPQNVMNRLLVDEENLPPQVGSHL